jgi:hypothetical protein
VVEEGGKKGRPGKLKLEVGNSNWIFKQLFSQFWLQSVVTKLKDLGRYSGC